MLWGVTQIPLKKLKPLRKIMWFALMLIFFHTFFTRAIDIEIFQIGTWKFGLSKTGAFVGLLMVAKLLTMLLATFVVRNNTKPKDFMRGLQTLGLSQSSAEILDAMFSMEGEARKSKKQKKKKGDAKAKSEEQQAPSPTTKQILRGNFTSITDFISDKLNTNRDKYSDADTGIIASFSIMVMLVRFLKIAPGFPIAPGHKNVLIVPLFILASRLTKTKTAATKIGFLTGTVHFAFGFGKYGPLGILQFAVMGIVVDGMMLLIGKSESTAVFALIGLIAGLTRVTAEIALMLLLEMPLEYYLLYSPYILSQCIFGASSAIVTKYLVGKIR